MARFSNGWVKVYRSVGEGDIAQNGYLLALWIRLLLWASWRPSKILWAGVSREIPAGSILTGYGELAESLGFSKSTVYKWLRYLASSERIVTESRTDGTLITVCNWADYQSQETELERSANEARTPAEHGANLIEEDKKGRKKNTRLTAYPEGFLAAYGEYPRKEGKSRAWKTYSREIGDSPPLAADLLSAIRNYRKAKAGSEPKYLKHFSTFMSEWRDWLDADAGTVRSASRINTKPLDVEAL